jgi:hypothetical protein
LSNLYPVLIVCTSRQYIHMAGHGRISVWTASEGQLCQKTPLISPQGPPYSNKFARTTPPIAATTRTGHLGDKGGGGWPIPHVVPKGVGTGTGGRAWTHVAQADRWDGLRLMSVDEMGWDEWRWKRWSDMRHLRPHLLVVTFLPPQHTAFPLYHCCGCLDALHGQKCFKRLFSCKLQQCG